MKINVLQGYSKILMRSLVTVKLNWTRDINSLRIRDAPGPENGNKPCSNKGTIQSHSAVRRRSVMNNRTPDNWSNAIQNVRRSNDWHTKSIPAETGRKMHKKLNINLSQIFIIEVGWAKVGTIGHTIKNKIYPRHGAQCVIQYPTNKNPAQSLQENAITVFGLRLYNSLPKHLRDIESVKNEKFKFELDKFLDTIPDQPKMPNYVTASGSNSQ